LEEPEAEAFFVKFGAKMWKRKLEAVKFCRSGRKLGSDKLYTKLEAEAKIILLLPYPGLDAPFRVITHLPEKG